MSATSDKPETTAVARSHRLGSIAGALQPHTVLPNLSAGIIGGLLCSVWGISLAALIFSGPLASHLREGIALGLVCAIVLNLAAAWGSAVPFALACAQESIIIIVAVMATSVAGTASARGSAYVFPTVFVLVALTSLCTGAFFLALGVFRLGRLVRYVPFPVIGGFLAGTGWLIVIGAVQVLTDISPTIEALPQLSHGTALGHVLPGILLAAALVVASRRFTHYLVMPTVLLSSAVLFYGALALAGRSPGWAQSHGWLLGPFASGSVYPPLAPGDFARVDWPALFGQAGSMATVLIVASVGLLLNVTGLEVEMGADLDMNRELRAMGIGNLAAGLGGGFAGFVTLSSSLVARKLGSVGRSVGMIAAAFSAVALLAGISMLAYVPRLLLGGLLLFLGLELLIEWIVGGWSRMPRVDFAIVVIILFVIGVWGVLPGLVIGVVLGILVFVVTYSRTGAVKHELSGGTYTSNVDRSPEVRACLEKQGERLYILVLQGFLFFGTTSGLLDHIHRRISDPARPAARFIVLDFHLVSGVDASITLSFAKLRKLAETHELSIVLTGPSQEVEKSLREVDVGPQGTVFLVFPDLDRGVEWCEDEIVRTEVGIGGEGRPLVDQLAAQLHEEDMAGRLMGYLERIEVPAGYRILRQGTPSDDMYLVESGQMSVLLEPPGGRTVRLRTIAAGALFGEIGFFLGTPRTASVVTTMPSVVYRFSQRALADMQEQDPPLAMALTELIVRMLGERVTNANKTIAALLR